MGRVFAEDLTDMDMDLKTQLGYHLRANHYPPVPHEMVPVCIEAIEAYNSGEHDKEIDLPEATTWRNKNFAPAWAIIEGHHLDPWLDDWED
jgi:hypothetical protein